MDAELREQLQSEIWSLESRLSTLRREALLPQISDELEDIDTRLASLPVSIEKIRTRGYAFKKDLEARAEALREQWPELRVRVEGETEDLKRTLKVALDRAEREFASLRATFQRSPSSAQAILASCQSTIEGLEDKVQAAQENIEGMIDTFRQSVNQTVNEVEDIAWMFDQLDEASFGLRPQENPIEATEAVYLTEPKLKGILYLTDQRLIFERKEDVVTKKVLFIPTKKKRVQEMVLDVPIGMVEECIGEEKGFILHKEILGLKFSPKAPVREARFQLKEDSSAWRALIGRVLSGEIEKERAIPEVPPEEVKEIPAKCPFCGAALPQEIVRGMTTITCEYCGNVIRLQ